MIDINCDMGESFGLYQMGDDEKIMPYITEANIACGYHASDPNHMRLAVERAKKHEVRIGAHFSLPDLSGFGRREMKMERKELTNLVIYQVGALSGFLSFLGSELSHLKPHGALYGMAAKQSHIAQAIADVAMHFKVPLIGMSGTLHELVCKERGIEFKAEFFADLCYADDGSLIITKKHEAVDLKEVSHICHRAITEGKTCSTNGKDIDIQVQTICVHSDTPNALEVAKAAYHTVQQINQKGIL